MNGQKIKNAAAQIQLSTEMKKRLLRACEARRTQLRKKKQGKPAWGWSKPAMVAALAACLLLSVTALAATGALQGFFKDITDAWGTVVGTTYEQATEELCLSAAVQEETLIVTAAFANKQPFEAETLGIGAYRIVDAKDKILQEGENAPRFTLVNGRTEMHLPLDGLEEGSYRLIITSLVAEKKADQPLNVQGYWECDFTKE